MRDELTLKQQRFVTAFLETANATESARRAGYKGNDVTLAAVGYENLRKHQIKKMIEDNVKKALTAEEVLQNLSRIANSEAEFKGSDVVKANELIGKHHKLFEDRTNPMKVDPDPVEATANLIMILDELRQNKQFRERLQAKLMAREESRQLPQSELIVYPYRHTKD